VVQQYGDTTHYLIPSENLPMFYPLRWIGLGPAVDVVEPLVRVFVELGYDRTTPYGEVARARLLPGLDNLTVENAQRFLSDVDAALKQGGEAFVDLFCPPKVGAETSPLQIRSPAATQPGRSPKRVDYTTSRAVSTPELAPTGEAPGTVASPRTTPVGDTAPVNVTANEPHLGGIPAAADKERDRVGVRASVRAPGTAPSSRTPA